MRIITLFLLVFYNSFTYRVLQHFFPWVSKSCQEQGSSCIEAWTIPDCVRILFEAFWWKAAQGLYFDAQANMSFFYRATKFSCFDVFCQIFFPILFAEFSLMWDVLACFFVGLFLYTFLADVIIAVHFCSGAARGCIWVGPCHWHRRPQSMVQVDSHSVIQLALAGYQKSTAGFPRRCHNTYRLLVLVISWHGDICSSAILLIVL